MVDYKGLAILIAAAGTLGLPIILVLTTVGGLFAGFAIYSILSFLSSWMVPLIFSGVGVIVLIELAPRGLLESLIGIVTLVVLVVLGYVFWSGALKGPANTYSILLSVASSHSSVSVPAWAFFWIAIGLAVGGIIYVVIREYD